MPRCPERRVRLFRAMVLNLSPPPRPYRVQSYTKLELLVNNVHNTTIHVMCSWYHGDVLADSHNVNIRAGHEFTFENMTSNTSCRWSITAIVFRTSLVDEDVITFSVVNNPDADKENKHHSIEHGMSTTAENQDDDNSGRLSLGPARRNPRVPLQRLV